MTGRLFPNRKIPLKKPHFGQNFGNFAPPFLVFRSQPLCYTLSAIKAKEM